MKIALIYCPVWVDGTPPLAISLLASFLRKQNHEVFPFDFNIEFCRKRSKAKIGIIGTLSMHYFDYFGVRYPHARQPFHKFFNNMMFHKFHPFKGLIDRWAKEVMQTGVQAVGFSVYNRNFLLSLYLARRIKELDERKIIVFGGPVCFNKLLSAYIIKSGFIDYVVTGEGELTLNEILNGAGNLEKSIPKGAFTKIDGEIMYGGDSPPIESLNLLPPPDYSDFDLRKYRISALCMFTSRGCPRSCSFCNQRSIYKGFRYKSAETVFCELRHLKNKYGVSFFFFTENLVNGNLEELEKLCDIIIKNRLSVKWRGNAIIREDMDFKLLKKMAKAGCEGLRYGVESGSQDILNGMNKPQSIEVIERVLRDTHRAGITVRTNFIVGLPTETRGDFHATLRFIRKNRGNIDNALSSIYGISLGSDIHINHKKYGIASITPYWRTKHSNMIERFKRYLIISSLTKRLGIESSFDTDRTPDGRQ